MRPPSIMAVCILALLPSAQAQWSPSASASTIAAGELNSKLAYQVGAGAPAGACIAGKDAYTDLVAQTAYWCIAPNVWVRIIDATAADFEAALGNPGTSGYILSSNTAGVRSWIAPPSGSGGSMTWPGASGIAVYGGSGAWGNSLGLVTGVGSPGADNNVPTEKAVATALAAKAASGAATAVNGQSCALGGSCAVTATPTAHAATHRNGGSDEIATATPAAGAIPKAGSGGTLSAGWLPAAQPSAIGGVNSADCSGTGHVQKINTDGSVACSADAQGGGAGTPCFVVARTSGTVLTIAPMTPACKIRVGSTIVSLSQTATVSNPSGFGTVRIWVDAAGTIWAASSLSPSCSGCSLSTAAAFPNDPIFPIYTWTATSGSWDVSGGTDLTTWPSMREGIGSNSLVCTRTATQTMCELPAAGITKTCSAMPTAMTIVAGLVTSVSGGSCN